MDVVEKLVLQVTWGDSKLFDAGGGQLLGRDHIFVSIGQYFYYDVGAVVSPNVQLALTSLPSTNS